MAFMRAYGMQGDPGPRPAPRRKSAAAGPRAKAARKRVVRGQRAVRGSQGASKAPGKKKKGGTLDLSGALGRTGDLLSQLKSGNLLGAAGTFAKGPGNIFKHGAAGGGGRRTINAANVKALRRSLRRVERFGALVSRVNKMLPRAHRFNVNPVLKHKGRKGRRPC